MLVHSCKLLRVNIAKEARGRGTGPRNRAEETGPRRPGEETRGGDQERRAGEAGQERRAGRGDHERGRPGDGIGEELSG